MDENVAEMASRDQLDRNLAGSLAMRHGPRLSATCGHFGISAFRHFGIRARNADAVECSSLIWHNGYTNTIPPRTKV